MFRIGQKDHGTIAFIGATALAVAFIVMVVYSIPPLYENMATFMTQEEFDTGMLNSISTPRFIARAKIETDFSGTQIGMEISTRHSFVPSQFKGCWNIPGRALCYVMRHFNDLDVRAHGAVVVVYKDKPIFAAVNEVIQQESRDGYSRPLVIDLDAVLRHIADSYHQKHPYDDPLLYGVCVFVFVFVGGMILFVLAKVVDAYRVHIDPE